MRLLSEPLFWMIVVPVVAPLAAGLIISIAAGVIQVRDRAYRNRACASIGVSSVATTCAAGTATALNAAHLPRVVRFIS